MTPSMSLLVSLLTMFAILPHAYHAEPMCGCERHYAALNDLFVATQGGRWYIRTGWGVNVACENWAGVTCNGSDVTALQLDNNNLIGTLPPSLRTLSGLKHVSMVNNLIRGVLPPSFSNWTGLESLRLSLNMISGTLPEVYAQWTNLSLFHLYQNSIVGTLPSAFSNWTNLTEFNLRSNRLVGSIPAEYESWTFLSTFDVGINILNGTLSAEFWKWGRMHYFDVSHNQLSGDLPSSFGQGWRSVTSFVLSDNLFTGSLPPEYGLWESSISSFAVCTNLLTGSLPIQYQRWSTVTEVQLCSNDFSGTLPAEYHNWTALDNFQVQDNHFTGSLPPEYQSWTSMSLFDVSQNSLASSLPASYSLWATISYVFVFSNFLNGTLPAEYSAWGMSLGEFRAGSNRISGTLPPEYSSWESVGTFDISDNNLEGSLPVEYGAWFNIMYFSASSNNLVGSLPWSYSQWGIRINEIYLNNNNLNGTLPMEYSSWVNVVTMDVSNNSISGTLPPEYGAWLGIAKLLLSMNQLSGSLPASYGAWTHINLFQVSQNRINGTLPSEYANWSVAMNNFDVSDCNLTGSIPREYGNWTSTNFFTVQRNALNGKLPFTLGMWTRLGMFDVSHNDLNGTLPSSFAGWMAPKSVRVSWNALCGTLSPDFSAWGAELIEFDATHNLISGIIPVEWGRTWTGPTAVSLGNNCLKGWVPDDLAMNAAVVGICNTRVAPSLSPNQVACPAGLLNAWPAACVTEESFSITASAPQRCLPIISFNADDGAAGSALVNDTFISVPPTDVNTLSSPIVAPAAVVVAIVRVTQDDGAHFYPSRTRTNSTTTTTVPSAPSSIIGSSSEEYRLTVDILTLPISRSVLKSAPVLLVNVSVWHALPLRTWEVSSVVSSWSDDSSGDASPSAPLNWTVLAASAAATPSSSLSSTYNSSSWQVLRLLPPTLDERQGGRGWLPITTPPLVSRVVNLRIVFSCGDEEVLDVNLLIPAPGYPQQLASQVEAATRYSQVASALAGGASSGSALGRVMAIRSMVVCDADASVGGGVLDFGIQLCSTSAETDVARSAVVSNVVVLACVFVFLLLLSCLWAHARGVSLRSALLVFSMPSSAYPACVAILPSTAGAITLLVARVNSSTCVGLDAVLIVLGLVVVVGCPSALLALWTIRGLRTSHQKWTCQKRGGVVVRTSSRERSNNSATTSSILTAASSRAALCLHGALGPVLRRSWKWHRQGNPTESATTTTGDSNMMKSAWVVLLEYRVLWFAALDAGMLVVIAVLAVVSGLDPSGGVSSSDLCQSTTAVVLVLLVTQLLLMVTLRPYTTLFAVVHGAVTLVLTCLSVGAQLAFIVSSAPADEEGASTNSVEGFLWLVNASAGCNLAVVGVTAVKMLFDVKDLLDAISRRLRQDRIHHSASSLLSPPCGTGERLPSVSLPSPTTPLESSILSLASIEEDECRATLPTMMIAIDDIDGHHHIRDKSHGGGGGGDGSFSSLRENDDTFEDHFGNKKFWDVNGNARREQQQQQHQHVDSLDVE